MGRPSIRAAIPGQDHRCFAPPSKLAVQMTATQSLLRFIFTGSPCVQSAGQNRPRQLLSGKCKGHFSRPASIRQIVDTMRSCVFVRPAPGFVWGYEQDYDCCVERESKKAARQHGLCRPPPAPAPERGASAYPQVIAEDLAFRADLVATRFGICLNPAAKHYTCPHLNGVIGRRAGDVAGFNTTAALSALDIA